MASTNQQIRPGSYRAEMDDAERASRDEIIALQTRRLGWALAHAYDNVAHYRKAFDKADVKPQDFRQLSDLRNFPFTAKTDLRDRCRRARDDVRIRRAGPSRAAVEFSDPERAASAAGLHAGWPDREPDD